MASLYDSASLVMIPSGVKESKLYSIKPTDGTGDFTFTRGTDTATRVNSAGLIEKETQNLLLQSNQFDTTWTLSNASVTGGHSGYDGNSTAWELERTGTSGFLYQVNAQSGVITFSFYAKENSLSWLRVVVDSGTNADAYINLSDGSVGGGSSYIDVNTYDVGNDWYRISITHNDSAHSNYRIYPAVNDGDISGTSGNIYIQSAQLEQSLVARTYIDTTTAAVYAGITDNLPRLDYSDSSCPALLLEPQRTNLVTQSEYTGGYSGFNSTQDFNAAISPEKVQNAVKIIATTHNTQHNRFTAFSASGSYSFSVFAKAGEYEFAQLYGGGNQGSRFSVVVNLSDGSIDTYDNITTSQIDVQDYGDGWYRIVVNGFNNTHTFIAIAPIKESGLSRDANYDIDYAGDGTSGVYFYGLQVEAGSYATSYIPCMGVSATRAKEGAQVTSVSDLIGQTQGTLFAEVDSFGVGESANRILCISNGTSAERVIMLTRSNGFRFIVTNSSVNGVDYTNYTTTNGVHKLAMTYDANEVRIFVDGAKVTTDSSVTLPSLLNSVHIGKVEITDSYNNNFGGSAKQALVFKTALTDAECITLTTL